MSKTNYQTLVPVIETERLVLRGHRLSDFEAFAANLVDPAGTRYTTGKALSEEEAWAKFLRPHSLWRFFGYGYWAVEEKAAGAFLGEVGFSDLKRDIKPSLKGIPEIGWVLASQAHGKGFGTEAVGAAIAWGDEYLKSKITCCLINQDNVASIRLAEKYGYEEYARTTYHDMPVIIFKRESS